MIVIHAKAFFVGISPIKLEVLSGQWFQVLNVFPVSGINLLTSPYMEMMLNKSLNKRVDRAFSAKFFYYLPVQGLYPPTGYSSSP